MDIIIIDGHTSQNLFFKKIFSTCFIPNLVILAQPLRDSAINVLLIVTRSHR